MSTSKTLPSVTSHNSLAVAGLPPKGFAGSPARSAAGCTLGRPTPMASNQILVIRNTPFLLAISLPWLCLPNP